MFFLLTLYIFFERRSIIYNKPYIYIYIYIFIYIYLYTHTPQIKYLLKDTTYHFIWGMVRGSDHMVSWIWFLCMEPTPSAPGFIFQHHIHNVFKNVSGTIPFFTSFFFTTHNSSLYSLQTWWTLVIIFCANRARGELNHCDLSLSPLFLMCHRVLGLDQRLWLAVRCIWKCKWPVQKKSKNKTK